MRINRRGLLSGASSLTVAALAQIEIDATALRVAAALATYAAGLAYAEEARAAAHGAATPRTAADMSGCKTLAATGSISAGSSQLILTSNPGFQVNDHVIVEIGGEAGAGQPGTMGVGGAWPTLSYATTAALMADTGQIANKFAWAQDTGSVYQWSGSVWAATTSSINWNYWYKSLPRALTAKVTAIAGGVTLTLDTTATAAAAVANVYFDNTPVINALIAANGNNYAYIFPAGTYYLGASTNAGPSGTPASIAINGKTNIMIGGQGIALTTLRTPKGAQGMEIDFFNSATNGLVTGLTLYGNFFLTAGWGFDYFFTGNDTAPPGIPNGVWIYLSDFCTVRNVAFRYCSRAVVSGYSNYSAAYSCTSFLDGQLAYLQWPFEWANSNYCWSYDCSATSTYLVKTFECFASNNCGHIRPTTVNGVFALNSTSDCVIDTPTVTITANSQYQPGTVYTVTINNPIFDVNQNIAQNRSHPAGTILNMAVTQQGYINANQDVLIGANAGTNGNSLIVRGGRFDAPNYSGNGNRGPQAANSDASNTGTIVQGLTATGTPNSNWGNINVQNGQVIGCTAPQIVCPGPGCAAS